MGLLDAFRKRDMIFTVAEAQEKLYASLSAYTGWKFIKSQRCLRKRIGNVVFDISFYSSKYNASGECIEANCEFEFWNAQFDKSCTVNSKIGFVSFQPSNAYWYDISTEVKLTIAVDDIKKKIDAYAIPLVNRFEGDYSNAINYLSSNEARVLYSLDKFDVFEKMRSLVNQ